MKADIDTHYDMRWWCIKNIERRNSYRQWRFDYPRDQKYGEPYEFAAVFNNSKDEAAFKSKFNLKENTSWIKMLKKLLKI